MRLPGIGRLLADGTLTRSKARLVAQVFEPLDEDEAARAEALVAGRAGRARPTRRWSAWPGGRRWRWPRTWPSGGGRRAERQARVTVFREQAGAVGLSGRDLPAAEALAGHANVVARARGVRGVRRVPRPGHQPPAGAGVSRPAQRGAAPGPDRVRRHRRQEPPETRPGPARPPEPTAGPGPPATSPAPVTRRQRRPGGRHDGGGSPGPGDGDDDDPGDADDDARRDDDGDGPDPGGDDGGDPGEPEAPAGTSRGRWPRGPLAEVTVPLATLQRRAERAGDNRLLGPLDPALARQLAAAAARSPHSRWEIIVVDEHGYATGHGIARPAPRQTRQPQPPGPGPPARPWPRCPHGSTSPSPRHSCASWQPHGRPAAIRRTAGRLGTDPGQTGHLDTDPARRPAADRAVRRRAHP